jgi:two-component system, NtrC family, nitrogen regulation sensor histidine kinase GlnL
VVTPPPALQGLDLLATAVFLIADDGAVRYLNPAAENLFEISARSATGARLAMLFPGNPLLDAAIAHAREDKAAYTEHALELTLPATKLRLSCTVTPLELAGEPADARFLLEFRHIEQQLRIAREERILDQSQANRELIRNLAHEIKNPLGGIRGAAQLLDRELERPNLHEYTQVIMAEADRLQVLMDRLLTPHRLPKPTEVNIHEVLERVRSVILAEYPHGIRVRRDYDTSLPSITGDREQLIQAVLNIVRNAAQAIVCMKRDHVDGEIRLRTRAYRSRCATGSSTRSCRDARAAPDSGSRSRRISSPSIAVRSRWTASPATPYSPYCCPLAKRSARLRRARNTKRGSP